MRLIDATRIEQYILNNCSDNEEINAIYGEIINAPTVDAVEVVRCKDCKYCTDCITDDGMNIYYRCLKDYEKPPYCSAICPQVDEDDYCSMGERRKDETN